MKGNNTNNLDKQLILLEAKIQLRKIKLTGEDIDKINIPKMESTLKQSKFLFSENTVIFKYICEYDSKLSEIYAHFYLKNGSIKDTCHTKSRRTVSVP